MSPSIGSNFPPSCQPFLVRDDFIVRADLFPLPGVYNGRIEQNHFILDNRFDDYLDERLASLHRAVDRYRCIDHSEPEVLADLYVRLLRVLASEYPDFVTITGNILELRHLGLQADLSDPANLAITLIDPQNDGGRRVRDWINAQAGIERLGDLLALAVQEDIVIMRLKPDGTHLAESLHVLLPSRWNPREKLLQGFDTIHEPIAEGHRLINSSMNVMRAMTTKGPFVRFGISFSTNPALDIHPDHPRPWDDAWLKDPELLARHVTMRVERQTTLPFADVGRGLFTIRVYTKQFTDVRRENPDLLPRLGTMIREAPPAILAYKGLANYADILADWCFTAAE